MATDFGEIEKRLNSDRAFKEKFLSDPVGTLKHEGLDLSPDMARKLAGTVKQLGEKNSAVAGSNLGNNKQEIGIGISIGKSF